MKGMNVRLKLMTAIIIVAVMVAITGVAGIIGLSTLNSNGDSIFQQVDVSDSDTANFLTILLCAVMVAATTVAIFFAFYISRLISKPLEPLTEFMNEAGATGGITPRQEGSDDTPSKQQLSKPKKAIYASCGNAASFGK